MNRDNTIISIDEPQNLPSVEILQNNEPENILEWKNISTFVKMPSPSIITRLKNPKMKFPKKKQVLFDVSCFNKSGLMLAIMGASGSGKTTLLSIISGVASRSVKVTGSVTLNNKVVDISSVSAYVEQSDIFVPTLTVKEHLTFYVKLRSNNSKTSEEIKSRVDELIKNFGLQSCMNSYIGSQTQKRGISGGESRRLSIASQVVTNPIIVFLDEPTSGLDSYTAESVITSLRKMAMKNCIIVSTIHQPSSQIFTNFDRLLLLSGGRVVYGGERTRALSFFKKCGLECPENYNPADFFIESIAIKQDNPDGCKEIVDRLVDENCNQSFYRKNPENHEHPTKLKRVRNTTSKTNLCVQFICLMKRSWLTVIREPMLFRARLSQTILIGIIYGLIYLQLKNDVNNIMNFAGALFGLLAQSSFSSVQGIIFIFPSELQVFQRDHSSKLYGTSMYFLSKTLAEIPSFVLTPIILTCITYYMIGLNPDIWRFFIHMLIQILITQCGLSFGYLISSAARDFPMASSISAPLMIPLMIFGGFFVRTANIPVYFIWISYISWFKYGFEALVIIQFKDIQIACVNDSIIRCPPGLSSISGNSAINQLGVDQRGLLVNFLAIIALIVGFRVLAWFTLLFRVWRNER